MLDAMSATLTIGGKSATIGDWFGTEVIVGASSYTHALISYAGITSKGYCFWAANLSSV